jgi:hypothetical protein
MRFYRYRLQLTDAEIRCASLPTLASGRTSVACSDHSALLRSRILTSFCADRRYQRRSVDAILRLKFSSPSDTRALPDAGSFLRVGRDQEAIPLHRSQIVSLKHLPGDPKPSERSSSHAIRPIGLLPYAFKRRLPSWSLTRSV